MCSVSRFSFHFFSQHEHDVWISRWMRCTERLVDDEEGFRFLCDRVNTLERYCVTAASNDSAEFHMEKSIPEKIAITPRTLRQKLQISIFLPSFQVFPCWNCNFNMHVAYNWKTFTFSSLFFSCENMKKLYERREFTTMPRNPAVNLAQSTKELSAVKQDTKLTIFNFQIDFILPHSTSSSSTLPLSLHFSLCPGHLKYYAFLCIQSFSTGLQPIASCNSMLNIE